MKKNKNIIEETFLLINMMDDEMPIYDFYLLKHYVISRIYESKRAKRKRPVRNK